MVLSIVRKIKSIYCVCIAVNGFDTKHENKIMVKLQLEFTTNKDQGTITLKLLGCKLAPKLVYFVLRMIS